MAFQPLISIITVTYNAEKFLERTIQSVIHQSYPSIEYILIDGQSKDNTLQIIAQYKEHIALSISEKDQGIYDAMNKGIQLAKGEYLWFLNAGDELYAPDTIERMFKTAPDGDVYYGDTLYFDMEGNELGLRSKVTPLALPEQLDWKSLQRGMVVCHQSFICKREIAVPYLFKEHPYSADIDWVIRVLKQSQKNIHTHQILSRYLQGGFSRKHLQRSLKDRFKILSKHYGLFNTLLNHVFIFFRGLLFILKTRKTY